MAHNNKALRTLRLIPIAVAAGMLLSLVVSFVL
jgi:hypothetical protein